MSLSVAAIRSRLIGSAISEPGEDTCIACKRSIPGRPRSSTSSPAIGTWREPHRNRAGLGTVPLLVFAAANAEWTYSGGVFVMADREQIRGSEGGMKEKPQDHLP